jgi:hypothetical protein
MMGDDGLHVRQDRDPVASRVGCNGNGVMYAIRS